MASPQMTAIADVRAQMGRDGKRAAQKTVSDARQRLTSTSGTRASFDFELMHDYAGARLIAALPMAVIVIILATVASFWVPLGISALWAATVLISLLAVVMMARRFKRADPSRFNAEKWTASFVAVEVVHGTAWSLLALFTLAADAQALASLRFATVVVSLAANAVATHSPPAATLMSTLPVPLAVSPTLLRLGGALHYPLAAVAIFGEVFFAYLARQLH